MKKYITILLLMYFTTATYADATIKASDHLTKTEDSQIKIEEDIVTTAENYDSFEVVMAAFVEEIKEYRAKKDFKMLCEIHLMTHEFMINNIKYSQEFNNKHPNLNYESLLNKLAQDNYDNKDGCTGKAETPFTIKTKNEIKNLRLEHLARNPEVYKNYCAVFYQLFTDVIADGQPRELALENAMKHYKEQSLNLIIKDEKEARKAFESNLQQMEQNPATVKMLTKKKEKDKMQYLTGCAAITKQAVARESN